MKKALVLFLILLIAVLSSACSRNDPPDNSSEISEISESSDIVEQDSQYNKSDITCPVCGSDDVASIMYGYPLSAEEQGESYIESVKRGDIIEAGCVVSEDAPTKHCKKCGHEFTEDEQAELPYIELFDIDSVKSGIVQITANYQYGKKLITLRTGTGFIVDSQKVITDDTAADIDAPYVQSMLELAAGASSDTVSVDLSNISYELLLEDGTTVPAKLLLRDNECGYAVFTFDDDVGSVHSFTMADPDKVVSGDTLYALGFHDGNSSSDREKIFYISIAECKVSRHEVVKNIDGITFVSNLTSDYYGAPLLNSDGEAVAVIVCGPEILDSGYLEQNENYAVADPDIVYY